jgi:hypothetical protein
MRPHEAQLLLDDARRLGDQTRDQLVRQTFGWTRVALAAVGLLIGLASVDLGNPWRTVAALAGFGMFAVLGIVQERRSLVRRRPSALEWLFWAGISVGLLALFSVARIAAWAWLDLPAHGLGSQGTFAAVTAAVAYVALTPVIRRAFRQVVLRGGGRTAR